MNKYQELQLALNVTLPQAQSQNKSVCRCLPGAIWSLHTWFQKQIFCPLLFAYCSYIPNRMNLVANAFILHLAHLCQSITVDWLVGQKHNSAKQQEKKNPKQFSWPFLSPFLLKKISIKRVLLQPSAIPHTSFLMFWIETLASCQVHKICLISLEVFSLCSTFFLIAGR